MSTKSMVGLATLWLTLAVGCGSKDDTGDSGVGDTDTTPVTGTGTGATGTGTGVPATGTGTGAATGTGTGGTTGLDIVGTWSDNYGSVHLIDETSWSQQYGTYPALVFHISQHGSDWLVAQNDAANSYNPDLWSRFDWTWDGADLYYCQSSYNAASEADALAVAAADSGDLMSGCGGFMWSALHAVVR